MSNIPPSASPFGVHSVDRHCLNIDVSVTRRKRWHYVTAPGGEHVFASHRSGDCWQWLRDNDIDQVWLITERMSLLVHIVDECPF